MADVMLVAGETEVVSPVATLSSSERERDDHYSRVIVNLNSNWRVIVCKDGIQWILQSRRGAEWRGRSYHTSRDSLSRVVRQVSGHLCEGSLEALDALPEIFPSPNQNKKG